MHNSLPEQLADRSQFGWRRSHLDIRSSNKATACWVLWGSLQVNSGQSHRPQVNDLGGDRRCTFLLPGQLAGRSQFRLETQPYRCLCSSFGCSTRLETLIAAVAQQRMAAALMRRPCLQHMPGTADDGVGAAADGSSACAADLVAARVWKR